MEDKFPSSQETQAQMRMKNMQIIHLFLKMYNFRTMLMAVNFLQGRSKLPKKSSYCKRFGGKIISKYIGLCFLERVSKLKLMNNFPLLKNCGIDKKNGLW